MVNSETLGTPKELKPIEEFSIKAGLDKIPTKYPKIK